MSKVKEAKKQNEFLNTTLMDLITLLDPSGKSKYVDLFVGSIKNKMEKELDGAFIEYFRENGLECPVALLEYDNITKRVWLDVLSHTLNMSDVSIVHKFHDLNERQLIINNDISKYKTLGDLTNVVNIAELRLQDKEMEHHIVVINDDDEWLVVRPLTHRSAVKYGYGTKWCTSMKYDWDHFKRYSYRGVLVYCLNKITGDKVAFFHNLDPEWDRETSFWNAKDDRIDSMETGLPQYIIDILKTQMTEKKTNVELQSDEIRKLEKEYMGEGLKQSLPLLAQPLAAPDPVNEAQQHLTRAINDWASRNEIENTESDGDEDSLVALY